MLAFGAVIYCGMTLTRLPLINDANEYVEYVSIPMIASRSRPVGCPCRNNPKPRHVRLLNSAARGTDLCYAF
jgi:hypothetical protein